jgi:N-acetylgalactosamine kinase
MGSFKRLLDSLANSSSENVKELAAVYGLENIDYQKRRYSVLVSRFQEFYPQTSDVLVVRAPGRVNLIGEHTDYNGLPVLPMAINRDILVAGSARADNQVRLKNVDKLYPDRQYEITAQIPPFDKGDWGNYSKAGVQTILDYLGSEGLSSEKRLCGMNLLVYGDLPATGGLSSSSALVVANALAALYLNQLWLEKFQLADLLAKGERYVGTEGGGMDQAASLLAERDQALKIDFFPLRVKPVPLPAGYKVIVVNSLIKAEKTQGSMDDYNRRPRECRMIVALINRALQEWKGENCRIERLADLEKFILKDPQIRAIIDRALGNDKADLPEIGRRLRRSVAEVEADFLTLRDGRVLSQPPGGFPLRQRFRHVISEAQRVEEAVLALENHEVNRLGELMVQSHSSCTRDFEISCPELDALVQIARESGAVGARLTGAGFGGCVVAFVEDSRVDGFIQRVGREYFQEYLKANHPEMEVNSNDLSNAILACTASKGACLVFKGLGQ